MFDLLAQPPSLEISVMFPPAGSVLPSTCQERDETGLELEVMQSKLRVWPTLAV